MKYKEMILLISVSLLGVATICAECECDDGTMDYSVDCDGDGTNDACSTDDCEACEAGNPASTGMECCGDEEFDPSEVGASKTWDISSVKSAIEAAVSAIPYVEEPEASASATISFTPCCDGSDGVVDDGVGTITGNASVSVTFDKTLSPFSVDFTFDIIGCEVGAIVDVGPYVSLTPSLSLAISGSIDNCADTADWGGSGTAGGAVTAGVRAETVAVVCGKSIYAKGNASATTGVKGTFSWNSSTGAAGNVCVDDLTGDISVSAEIPFWGEEEFDVIKDYVFISGNC
jgi:hypothetical protein